MSFIPWKLKICVHYENLMQMLPETTWEVSSPKTGTFPFKISPYKLMHAYFPPFVHLHASSTYDHPFSSQSKLQRTLCYATQFSFYTNSVQALSLCKLYCRCFFYAFIVHLFLLCKTSKSLFFHASIPSQKSFLSFSEIS